MNKIHKSYDKKLYNFCFIKIFKDVTITHNFVDNGKNKSFKGNNFIKMPALIVNICEKVKQIEFYNL